MIVRDTDVLQDLSKRTTCRVHISIPTVDEEAWEKLEPGVAHPTQRLRAVRQLVDAGIDCGVLMAPIVPGFSTHPAKIERTIKAIAESGARSVGAMVMHLDGGTRDHFMAMLNREYPEMVEKYEKLYAQQVRREGLRQARSGSGVADAGAIRNLSRGDTNATSRGSGADLRAGDLRRRQSSRRAAPARRSRRARGSRARRRRWRRVRRASARRAPR